MVLRLLGRISSGARGDVGLKISEGKLRFKKNGGGEEYQVVLNY